MNGITNARLLLLGGLSLFVPAVALAQNPGVSGEWGPVLDWPLQAIHGVLLKTGKVLVADVFQVRIWDPATGELSENIPLL